MPRERIFDEESQSISVRVPKSEVEDYREAIRKFVLNKYKEDKKEALGNEKTKD